MSSSIVWHPTPEMLRQSEMAKYISWLKEQYNLSFSDYQGLHQWSVTHIEDFWESIWRYKDVEHESMYRKVLESRVMPGAQWFEGARLNFAKNIIQPWMMGNPKRVAIVALDEERNRKEISAEAFVHQVTVFQAFLRKYDVRAGDKVAGIVCNDEKSIIASLATSSLGGVWASCAPEFGWQSLVDRLSQVQPKVLFAVNGYSYNGKEYDISAKVEKVIKEIPSIEAIVWIPKITKPSKRPKANLTLWREIASKKPTTDLTFVPLPFHHPLYILFSSGTTGKPKSIVHSAGGVLLQHFKELALHCNLTENSVLSYYTTCGWMMWNWMVSGLMTGARLVVYNGSPSYPSIERLWRLIENESVTHFGTSAKFIATCRTESFSPKRIVSTASLQNIFSTGSPLVAEDYDWVFSNVKKDVQLTSISGGTDIISCFVLGNPISPIYRGEIQCKGLGMDVVAFNEQGQEVVGQKGELVCKTVVPCMPVHFLDDLDGQKYHNAYFAKYEGIWCHGDYVMFNERGGSVIFGRSDTTLNPGGVRIGTSEIYRQLDQIQEVQDSIVASVQHKSDEKIVLLVMLQPGISLTHQLKAKIKEQIKIGASPRHVPEYIFSISQIPYTLSGKKVEKAVKQMLHGQEITNLDAISNPDSLEEIKKLKDEIY
ncbi:MAG: acetoacetate--CoA ligase [Bdellovibrionota bacterium]|nr:acetoacetate--CoA ligase [Deltaproteobacteria bacterium]